MGLFGNIWFVRWWFGEPKPVILKIFTKFSIGCVVFLNLAKLLGRLKVIIWVLVLHHSLQYLGTLNALLETPPVSWGLFDASQRFVRHMSAFPVNISWNKRKKPGCKGRQRMVEEKASAYNTWEWLFRMWKEIEKNRYCRQSLSEEGEWRATTSSRAMKCDCVGPNICSHKYFPKNFGIT